MNNDVELIGLDEAEIPSQSYPEFARWEEVSDDYDRGPRRGPPPRPRERTVVRERVVREPTQRLDTDIEQVPPVTRRP